ncbi:MAG: hypothetical protein ACREFM_05250, partial [Hypericibacter sp.]
MKIVEFGKDDSSKSVAKDRSERMKILEFGDGAHGARPPSGSKIEVRPASAAPQAETRWEPAPSAPSASLVAVPKPKSSRSPFVGSKSLKMHVLDLGKLRLDKNFMVANSTVAMAKNPNPPGKLIDIPVSAYYIEHPDGNVLFDTGCHPDWAGSNGRWPQNLQDVFPVIGPD